MRVTVAAAERAPAIVALSIGFALVLTGVLRAQKPAPDTVGSCWNYETPDARFELQVVARGLSVPVSLAFLPGGRALVAERPSGRLSFVDLQSGAIEQIKGMPPVVGQVDGGLLDVIVHPDFAHDGTLYYAYSEHTDSGNATVIERARLEGNRVVDRTRLLSVHPYLDNVNQFGARLVLDHGYLYIGVGERDVPALAQDLASDAGKILRLREDGSVPRDNPFVGKPGARPEIWSYGHRNPHGLAIDPRTGLLWEHEHGPRGGDEINLIRPGRNYGWPVITYGIEYTGEPVGEGITRHAGMEQPKYFYIPSIAPTGMTFYSGANFAPWRGSIFLGSLSYRHLNRVVLNGQRIVREERLLRDRGWRIREVRQGLDGFLYLGVESGLIARIRPATNAACAHGIGASGSWVASPVTSPTITGATLAYDADRHRVMMLGSNTADTTWEWDGQSWTPVASPAPFAHTGQAMATDPSGGVLLFGGLDRAGVPTRDAWHEAAGHWAPLQLSGPPAQAGATMTFDLDHHRTLLRGGAPCTDRRMWSWNDTTWAIVDSAGPRPRIGASIAYDPTTRSVVLAGGRECDAGALAASWRWDGKRWSALNGLPTVDRVCLVYSPTRNRMLLFAMDSITRASAWELRGTRWHILALAPPLLADAACVVDPANERVVLVGRRPALRAPSTYLLLR
ncbi:MAG: PQQ-dependent sugar dehydrogenase [Gemmatimonadota bacterium]